MRFSIFTLIILFTQISFADYTPRVFECSVNTEFTGDGILLGMGTSLKRLEYLIDKPQLTPQIHTLADNDSSYFLTSIYLNAKKFKDNKYTLQVRIKDLVRQHTENLSHIYDSKKANSDLFKITHSIKPSDKNNNRGANFEIYCTALTKEADEEREREQLDRPIKESIPIDPPLLFED